MGSKTRVTFTRDYRGRATGEQFFTAGTTVDLPSWMVGLLRAEGVIETPVVAEIAPPVDAGAGMASPPSPAPAVRAPAKKRASKKAAKKVSASDAD